MGKRFILFAVILFVSNLNAQLKITKDTSIEQLFLLPKNNFPSIKLTHRFFDTINSPIYDRINLNNLKGHLALKNKSGYKILITSNTESWVLFNFDSIIGIIIKKRIDTLHWYGRLLCIDKKNKKELFNFDNNLLLGTNGLILLFSNNTPTFRKRASIMKIDDITRIKILDDSLLFKELLFLNVNYKEPTTSVMISYVEKYKSDFVNTYVVNKDFIGSLLNKTIDEVTSMYREYLDSRSFILQYPVSFFKLHNYGKFKYRLDRKVLWLYHEDFFLNPFAPLTCCD